MLGAEPYNVIAHVYILTTGDKLTENVEQFNIHIYILTAADKLTEKCWEPPLPPLFWKKCRERLDAYRSLIRSQH